MQGIVGYVHQKNGNVIKYWASMDIEGDRKNFELRKQNAGENRRDKYLQKLDFEVVEITDDLNARFAYYVLPQSDRIAYDESIIEYILDHKVLKIVVRALDWTIEHFPEVGFSYKFSIVVRENKKAVKVLIFEDGKKFEAYTFFGAKEPKEREFYGGDGLD